jgi:hypothetical protein
MLRTDPIDLACTCWNHSHPQLGKPTRILAVRLHRHRRQCRLHTEPWALNRTRGAVSMKLTQLAAGGSAQWQRLMRFGGVGEEADS